MRREYQKLGGLPRPGSRPADLARNAGLAPANRRTLGGVHGDAGGRRPGPRAARRRAGRGAPARGARPADRRRARPGRQARPHDGGSARQGADHRAGGSGLPEPPPRAHRRSARLPARALRRAAVHGLVGARRARSWAGRWRTTCPSLVVPPIVARLRHETQNVILPGEEEDLRRYLEERRRAGMRLNLNQLGEAILGEAEAARRLQAYLALLARDDVEYISVKVSSVFSQIDLVAFRATVARVAERLRTLYRAGRAPSLPASRRAGHAEVHQPRHGGVPRPRPHGDGVPRGAGRAGVPAAQRGHRAAGLPARLAPGAARAHRRGRSRVGPRGGAPIKLRIVKGANLAMERIEAAVHGWPQAPYETKAEVDANYKRMVEYGCRPEHARGRAPRRRQPQPLRHRLRPRCCARPTASSAWVEFEMLEGMANHQARAVQARAGGLLLYAPVVRAEDFHSAIAYLVRRLDENTAPENFLRHVFDLEPGSPDVGRRARPLPGRVRPAGRPLRRAAPHPGPRGRGARRRRPRRSAGARSRTSPTPTGRWPPTAPGSSGVRGRWRERPPDADPAPDRRRARAPAPRGAEGRDPSRPGASPIATRSPAAREVDRALDAARAAQPAWGGAAAPRARGACSRRARPSSAGGAAI